MNLHLFVLILSFFSTEFVWVDSEYPDNDSLRAIITQHIDGMELRRDYAGISTAARKGVDSIALEMELISQQYSEDIANSPKLKELFDKYTALYKQIKEQTEQSKRDSVVLLFRNKVNIYDSLYKVGLRLSEDKKGDSVVELKRRETEYWIGVKSMENDHNISLQSDSELQKIIDTINMRHEQITTLSEERGTTFGDVLLKYAPLVLSLGAMGMAVKGKIDRVKQAKQLKEKEKEAELLLKKQQEDLQKAQELSKNAQE